MAGVTVQRSLVFLVGALRLDSEAVEVCLRLGRGKQPLSRAFLSFVQDAVGVKVWMWLCVVSFWNQAPAAFQFPRPWRKQNE